MEYFSFHFYLTTLRGKVEWTVEGWGVKGVSGDKGKAGEMLKGTTELEIQKRKALQTLCSVFSDRDDTTS